MHYSSITFFSCVLTDDIWLSWLQGVFISRVSEDGPAGKAGVVVGDKLLSVIQPLHHSRKKSNFVVILAKNITA